MSYVTSLRCKECSREFPIGAFNVCDFCFGPLEVVYDYDAIAKVVSRERIMAGPTTSGATRTFSPPNTTPTWTSTQGSHR